MLSIPEKTINMKNQVKSLLIVSLIILLGSCSAPKNVAYFQNAEDIRGMALQDEHPLRLRPKDKINIIVSSADPMLVRQFNLTAPTSSMRSVGSTTTPTTTVGNSSGGGSSSQLLAYTVDEQGDINFPVLGKVAVEGKTRQEVAEYIRLRLINRDLVRDPIVTVEYVNLSVNVLGEVNHPGRIEITKDYLTIIDAIAKAGDLTVLGQRENVMVIREVDGEDQTYVINLCDRQDILNSPAYYLQQNDIVYVTPNSKKRREAKSAGNIFNQPSVWISLASLLTTITALAIK
jgi:polysaccharide export outer membrane protein